MKKIAIIFIMICFMSCFTTGCMYVHVKAPFDIDTNQTEMGTKIGKADAYSLFWLAAWGDASYATAAKNGNIRVIKHADQEIQQVLFGLYTRWTVIIYGD